MLIVVREYLDEFRWESGGDSHDLLVLAQLRKINSERSRSKRFWKIVVMGKIVDLLWGRKFGPS